MKETNKMLWKKSKLIKYKNNYLINHICIGEKSHVYERLDEISGE